MSKRESSHLINYHFNISCTIIVVVNHVISLSLH